MDAAGAALAAVRQRARGGELDRSLRVTLHFHPDRVFAGRTVLERLADDGIYRSQFETGTSNGGLTAHPGGERWRWESRLFESAYDGEPPSARPVYGSLNHHRRLVGGSPRFGSAYLRLRASTLDRTTFCWPDSFFEPVEVGTADRAGLVQRAQREPMELLDDYVEAQVHGGVRLDRDVEALVLDPSFAGSDLDLLARRLPCRTEWHIGFRLDLPTLAQHRDYRTTEAAGLAESLSLNGFLDARRLGEAAADHDPQVVKHVWHLLARWGTPADGGTDASISLRQ